MFSTTYDAKTKTWLGPKTPSTYNPNQNIGSLLLQCLQFRSTAIAQISADDGTAITCKQFRERAILMTQYFAKLNLKKNDFIGFVTSNTENLFPTVVGCYAMGLPICPLSPMMTVNDIIQTYSAMKPKIIFCDKKNIETVQEAVSMMNSNAKILTIMEKVSGYECATEIMRNSDHLAVFDFVAPDVDPDHILGVICSSGSTESPKRIIKTHRDMIEKFSTGWHLKYHRPSVYFTYSPIFWISGFNATVFTILNQSVNVITTEVSHPVEIFIDILLRYRVTYLATLPFMLSRVLEIKNLKPFEHIESWMLSGFAATKELCSRFAPYIPNGYIWVNYGLTETGIISVNNSENYETIGLLCPNVEIKLLKSSGGFAGPNEVGEILIKDEPKFAGYYGDPEKTAKVVKNGWFHTSDFAYFDNNNLMYYVDRKVEIMNYEGYYIIPNEIEPLINEVDGVKASTIVGILEKDTMNYIVHAFVVPDETKNITEDKVLEIVNSKVIEQRKLRGGVHFVKSFPIDGTGNVDKIKLRQMAMEISP